MSILGHLACKTHGEKKKKGKLVKKYYCKQKMFRRLVSPKSCMSLCKNDLL